MCDGVLKSRIFEDTRHYSTMDGIEINHVEEEEIVRGVFFDDFVDSHILSTAALEKVIQLP